MEFPTSPSELDDHVVDPLYDRLIEPLQKNKEKLSNYIHIEHDGKPLTGGADVGNIKGADSSLCKNLSRAYQMVPFLFSMPTTASATKALKVSLFPFVVFVPKDSKITSFTATSQLAKLKVTFLECVDLNERPPALKRKWFFDGAVFQSIPSSRDYARSFLLGVDKFDYELRKVDGKGDSAGVLDAAQFLSSQDS